MKYTAIQPWHGYNCLSAAVGAALHDRGEAILSLALDSGLDFFYDPDKALTMNSLGVWPGTEHSRIGWSLRALLGMNLQTSDYGTWGAFYRALHGSDHHRQWLLALSNTECPHIPSRQNLDTLAHYVLLTACSGRQADVYDPMFRHHGRFSLADLERAMSFVDCAGQPVRYRACVLRPAETAAPTTIEHVVSRSLLAPGLHVFFPHAKGRLFATAAVRALANRVRSLHGATLQRECVVLFQALRYVQYQRSSLARYLRYVETVPIYAGIAGRLRDCPLAVADAWFQVKFRVQYMAITGKMGDKGWVSGKLDALAAQESALSNGLAALRDSACDYLGEPRSSNDPA